MGGITEEDLSLDETADEIMDTDDAEALARESLETEERTTIVDLLKKIAKVGTNTKARALKTELEKAFTDGYDSAIIFSQYAETMDFLKDHLAEEFPGETIACYSVRADRFGTGAGSGRSVPRNRSNSGSRPGRSSSLSARTPPPKA